MGSALKNGFFTQFVDYNGSASFGAELRNRFAMGQERFSLVLNVEY